VDDSGSPVTKSKGQIKTYYGFCSPAHEAIVTWSSQCSWFSLALNGGFCQVKPKRPSEIHGQTMVRVTCQNLPCSPVRKTTRQSILHNVRVLKWMNVPVLILLAESAEVIYYAYAELAHHLLYAREWVRDRCTMAPSLHSDSPILSTIF
jgi:hypothetical protein